MNKAEKTQKGAETIDELLHFGIKGMRWGVRRQSTQGPVKTNVTRSARGQVQIKTTGGGKSSASVDAIRVAQARQKLRAGGVNTLSNQELQILTKRMDLETKLSNLKPDTGAQKTVAAGKKGYKVVKEILQVGATVNTAIQFYNSPAGALLKQKFAH